MGKKTSIDLVAGRILTAALSRHVRLPATVCELRPTGKRLRRLNCKSHRFPSTPCTSLRPPNPTPLSTTTVAPTLHHPTPPATSTPPLMRTFMSSRQETGSFYGCGVDTLLYLRMFSWFKPPTGKPSRGTTSYSFCVLVDFKVGR